MQDKATYSSVINLPITSDTVRATKHYRYRDKEDNILYSCEIKKHLGVISFPRDLYKYHQFLKPLGYELVFDVVDTKTEKPIKLTNLSLRDYQKPIAQEVVDKLHKSFNVVLNAETGLGKSYLVPYFISQLQVKTLILVDRTTLAQQMYDEITHNSNANVTILKPNSTLSDVNITTIQMLLNNLDLLEKIKDIIGFVIVDECHFISVNTFTKIVQSIPSKYRLGLSATPTRSDGMTEVIYDVMGRSTVIGKNPNALTVGVHVVQIPKYFSSGARDYKKNLAQFMKNSRQEVLKVIDLLVKDQRSICLATDVKATQEYFAKWLNKLGIPAEVVNSDVDVKTRKEIFDRVNTNKTKVIIGMVVLEKGVSIPRLDTVVHLSGASTKEKINQLMGRLKRDNPEKQKPLLVDLNFLGSLERQQRVRKHEYKRMEAPIKAFSYDKYLKLWQNKLKGIVDG